MNIEKILKKIVIDGKIKSSKIEELNLSDSEFEQLLKYIETNKLVIEEEIEQYENIEVEYYDVNFNKHKQEFSGFTAQIIQHEVDHFEGIII